MSFLRLQSPSFRLLELALGALAVESLFSQGSLGLAQSSLGLGPLQAALVGIRPSFVDARGLGISLALRSSSSGLRLLERRLAFFRFLLIC